MCILEPRSSTPLEDLSPEVLKYINHYNAQLNRIVENFKAIHGDVYSKSFVPLQDTSKPVNQWMVFLYNKKDWVATMKQAKISDSMLYFNVENAKSVIKKIHVALRKISIDPEIDPYVLIFQELANDFEFLSTLSSTAYS